MDGCKLTRKAVVRVPVTVTVEVPKTHRPLTPDEVLELATKCVSGDWVDVELPDNLVNERQNSMQFARLYHETNEEDCKIEEWEE